MGSGRRRVAFTLAAACIALTAAPAPAGAAITPFAECMHLRPPMPPDNAVVYDVYFGYVNDGAPQNIEFGGQNQVIPGFGFQGQPTVFNSGSYPRVFKAAFNASVFSAIAWELQGTQAIATQDGIDSPPTPPTPVCASGATGPASAVTPAGATLNGTVQPGGVATSYNFDYGETIAYGSSTPPQVTSSVLDVPVSEPIFGLKPNTTYHFRLVAQGQENTVGEDRTFTTPPAPPADLSLAWTGATKARAGKRAAITLTVTNRGPGNATGIELLQSLPAGLRFVSGTGPGGPCAVAGTVRCPFGTLTEGGSASASVVVKAKRRGRYGWWASATGDQPEARAADNVTAGSLRVRKARRHK